MLVRGLRRDAETTASTRQVERVEMIIRWVQPSDLSSLVNCPLRREK